MPEIAARAGADGAHLTGIEAFMAAVDSLKPAKIAGCGGLNSRDDAMLAGERGADYVMFGQISSRATAPVVRRDRRADRMVGGAVHGSLRRICRNPRGNRARCRPPAPISSRSATPSGTTRAARSLRLPRRHACSRRSRCDECKRTRILAAIIGAVARRPPRRRRNRSSVGTGSGLRRIPARPLRRAPSRRRCGGSRRKTIPRR